ncbi:sigma 54-interacting transcriptional regulator [Tumebacillus sp. ITR2]|uniref:Sigma 54-interacting transcriptional regulator n=1 Tax=Tumebacillus amylolyticus TaxID=2801339 RepID=A0ABS1J500_9BACL|nr:sigma 54-interacting transcriptional regulator [Tumebacillus amylolyticus]MBL0385345.1 sigma 54-interacting transcriptional regulator [Tumebacillus amylolyticus]
MDRETRETVEMLNAILASIDEGIHAVDRKGNTIYYNRAAARLDGLDPQEVIGRHVLEVFPSLEAGTSTLLRVIETGQRIPDSPQTYTTSRGTKVHTVNTTLPILSGGKLIGALEVAKDLTRLKEVNEKLIDLQAQVVGVPKGHARKRSPLEARWTFDQILTRDRSMLLLKELAARAAGTSSPVLLSGETGTGKELFVQSIHNASPRRNKPFIAQNCAALPASLLEGLLFGTVKGSFTGAENRPGLFELADGGTLFLDEINSMPMELQAKLLRVLQEGLVRRVGDSKVIEVDVRILAATNQNPLQAIEAGMLRSDLYYRLNVVSLHLPRLAERRSDIPLLAMAFLEKFNAAFGKRVVELTSDVQDRFLAYDWPGNVRELEHAIEGAMNLVEGDRIEREHLPWSLQHATLGWEADLPATGGVGVSSLSLEGPVRPLRETMERVEQELIRMAMEQTNGNIQQAAKLLQVPRQTLQYRLGKQSKS